MKPTSMFRGARRAIPAVASLTTKELLRNGTVGLILLGYLVYLAVYRRSIELSDRVSTARFLDHALGGISAVLLMTGIFAALQGHVRETRASQAARQSARIVGSASFYWGRLCGISLVLLLLSVAMAATAILHYVVRFGDVDGGLYPVNRYRVSDDFVSANEAAILRKKGDRLAFNFGFDPEDAFSSDAGRVLMGRFAPRLMVAQEGVPIRSLYPIRLHFRDPDGDWMARKIVRLDAGKPRRFDVPLPRRGSPEQIEVTVELLNSQYFVKFYRDDLAIVGASRSFFAAISKGVVALALYAAVMTAIALFFTRHFSYGASLMVSAGLAVAMASLDVLELSVLSSIGELPLAIVLEGLRTILPDYDQYDVTALLVRGRGIDWEQPGSLLLRLALTGITLGLISGKIDTRETRR